MRFAGQTALVTGSSRGIGRAVALRLAEEGADVVVHFRRNADAAEDAAAAVTALGRRAVAVRADLGEPEAVDALFDKVRASFGSLDILVANAAAHRLQAADRNPAAITCRRRSPSRSTPWWRWCNGAAELMHGRSGKIVTVSGIDARRYVPLHGAMAAAKGAAEVLTAYLACELAPRGIRVNGVNPGFVDTDSAASSATASTGGWRTTSSPIPP